MTLDSATRRNLELTETIRGGETQGSLLNVLDHTITPMGHRAIRIWVSKPLLDMNAIQQRQDGVAYLVENGMARAELRAALRPLGDLERLVTRIISGHALPRDLVSARSTLRCLPAVRALIPEDVPAFWYRQRFAPLPGGAERAGCRDQRRPTRHVAKYGYHPARFLSRTG